MIPGNGRLCSEGGGGRGEGSKRSFILYNCIAGESVTGIIQRQQVILRSAVAGRRRVESDDALECCAGGGGDGDCYI